MSVRALFENFKDLRQKPFWKLLASDNAPETIAILHTLFFDEEKSLKLSILQTRLERALDETSIESHSRDQVNAYINDLRTKGYLSSRFELGADEPTFELSVQAYDAIRFVDSQTKSRVAPTEGRLELVTHAVSKLNDDTNGDVKQRIRRLRLEKKRLDKKIADLVQGRISPISDLEIKSQFSDIIEMLEALDGDFLRVCDRFHELADLISERMMQHSGTPDELLSDFFESFDEISESEEGRTFQGFYKFLNDEKEMADLDANIQSLKEREFWKKMPERNRQKLSEMRSNLMERARDTQAVLKRLSGHLRRLVQSREYLKNRRLAELIDETRALALSLVKQYDIKGQESVLNVHESRIEMVQPVECRLDDPEIVAKDESLELASRVDVDLKDLSDRINAAEINYPLLKRHLAEILQKRTTVTIGELLDKFPATQGLATAIGYMRLAQQAAVAGIDANGVQQKEQATWKNRLGQTVLATIPVYYFSTVSLKTLNIQAEQLASS